jgi:uncharacterized protein (TIGR01627 family)
VTSVNKIIRSLCRRLLGGVTTTFAASRPSYFSIAVMREANWILLSAAEIHAIAQTVRAIPGCRLLVFGAGHDSRFWVECNQGNTTVFLEHNTAWAEQIANEIGRELIFDVSYRHRRSDWLRLLDAPDQLACVLPPEVSAAEWDIVLVDGPPGYLPEQPGRMQSIFTAAKMVRPGGYVIVHDCDREVERIYCDRFLGPGNLQRQVGILRIYKKPDEAWTSVDVRREAT